MTPLSSLKSGPRQPQRWQCGVADSASASQSHSLTSSGGVNLGSPCSRVTRELSTPDCVAGAEELRLSLAFAMIRRLLSAVAMFERLVFLVLPCLGGRSRSVAGAASEAPRRR
jgi:hypothetical protein